MGDKARVVAPGGTLGILGGGQLGRMIALAAARLGLRVHIYHDEPDCPAFAVAAEATCAAFDDTDRLAAFARSVDVVTYEFENVPEAAARAVSAHAQLHPGAGALATTQDRLLEKRFVSGIGIATAPFRAVDSHDDLSRAIDELGAPCVLKTRRFGYDGKGQVKIAAPAEADAAFEAIGRAPAILEGFIPFIREISIVAARGADGAFVAYPACANSHRNHILDVTTVPAGIAQPLEDEAREIARRIAVSLDYVGVLAVELFLVPAGEGEALVVNEIAPRVHNSGHWTVEGARTSQFEQHVRAVCGWPLGAADLLGRVEMRNLIGDDVAGWAEILRDPAAHLTLYGKREARPGRKMGHVVRIAPFDRA